MIIYVNYSTSFVFHSPGVFLCFEIDSYGHYFRKAKTRTEMAVEPHWGQDFIIELEGSQMLRVLCYEEHPTQGLKLRGKAHIEVNISINLLQI